MKDSCIYAQLFMASDLMIIEENFIKSFVIRHFYKKHVYKKHEAEIRHKLRKLGRLSFKNNSQKLFLLVNFFF